MSKKLVWNILYECQSNPITDFFLCSSHNTCKTRQPIKQFAPKLPVLIPLWEGVGVWFWRGEKGGKATSLGSCPHPKTNPHPYPLEWLLCFSSFLPTHTHAPKVDWYSIGRLSQCLPAFPLSHRQFSSISSSFVGRLRFGFAATRYALICSAAKMAKAIGKSANILPGLASPEVRSLGHATSCCPPPLSIPFRRVFFSPALSALSNL